MYESDHEIFIAKPIDFVYANVTCMKGCIQWVTGMTDASKVGDEPVQVGTQYVHQLKFMGVRLTNDLTVTIYEPNHVFAYHSEAPQTSVDVHYTFEEVEGGTRVHNHMTLTPKETIFGRIAAPLLVSRGQNQYQQDLENLKHMLEHDVVVQAV